MICGKALVSTGGELEQLSEATMRRHGRQDSRQQAASNYY